MCTKYISGFAEWNGPPCTPPPHGPRTTIGTGRAPKIMRLGGEIGDLIEAAGDEIDELHFGDGTQSQIAHAARGADNGRFADGRIDHAFGAETLQQSLGDFERAAVDADIFADRTRLPGRAPFPRKSPGGWLRAW